MPQTLPEISIRHHPIQQQSSIHTLNRQQRKSLNNKHMQVKQSLLLNNNTPLHQYVRMSFSNKTVVYKKRLVNQDRYNRENVVPVSVHQSNQILIVNSSPRLKTEGCDSQLRGCKSLLNTKVREKRNIFDIPRKYSQKIKEKEQHSSLFDIGVSKDIGRKKLKSEQFDLLPWQNQQSVYDAKQPKEQGVLRPLRRFF